MEMRAEDQVTRNCHLMALGTRDPVKGLALRGWLGGWDMADLSLELGQ